MLAISRSATRPWFLWWSHGLFCWFCSYYSILKVIPQYLPADFETRYPVEIFNGSCEFAEIDRLTEQLKAYDGIIAFGGGQLMDTSVTVLTMSWSTSRPFLLIVRPSPLKASSIRQPTRWLPAYAKKARWCRYPGTWAVEKRAAWISAFRHRRHAGQILWDSPAPDWRSNTFAITVLSGVIGWWLCGPGWTQRGGSYLL